MIGKLLGGRYELQELLQEGPILTAYAAFDRAQGREVCLRVLRAPYSEEPEFRLRLAEVVRKYREVYHPALEPIVGLEEDGSLAYLVGELSRGVPLHERIQKLAPFSVPVCLEVAIAVCEGLEALHRTGLAHGDVSARQIVSLPSGAYRLQMTGIWEAYSASAEAGAAVLPQMAPSLAPEVSQGQMPSQASDVYSVGVLLYQLLTGRMPFAGETPTATVLRHQQDPVPNVRMYNPSVPHVLNEIVKKALAKSPEERYSDAGAFLADLRVLLDALRFGRSLSWPIRGHSIATGTESTEPAAQSVTPKMSAVREPARREERVEKDVPLWMLVTVVFFSAIVVGMIGLWVFLNLNKPKLIEVPNIANLGVEEAREMLTSLDLDLRISARQRSDKVPPEHIVSVDPPPGETVREGGRVNVVVSSGSRFVEVPDLRGIPLEEARALLDSLDLDLDDDPVQVRSKDFEAGMIVGQTPSARSKVERETRVRVEVSSGRSAPERGDPEDAKEYRYTLTIRLDKLERSVHLKVDITDSRGTRTVHDALQFPDDAVTVETNGFGREAIFRIFYDGQIVKQVEQRSEEEAL